MSQITFKLHISRLMALLLCVMLVLPTFPAAYAAEGSCGDNLNWSFNSGTLTITGSGDMKDYNEFDLPPWYEFREEIIWLSLPDGLTSVGTMAFYDCVNLTSVAIPSTVTEIGELAFCQNRSMALLTLGGNLRFIGRSAFEQCEKLQDVRLPDTLTTIESHAFYYCGSLAYVTIPASVGEMGSGVFAYCRNLVRADVYAPLDVLPTWTFYGCDKLSYVSLPPQMNDTESYAFYGCDALSTVNMGGESVDAGEMKEKIDQDVPGFDRFGEVTNGESTSSGIVTDITANDNGSFTVTDTTVTQTGNTTVSTSTSNTKTDGETKTEVDITATVVTPEGWTEVVEQIQNAQDVMNDNNSKGSVNVDVFVGGNEEVPDDVLQSLAGSNVNLTVQTQSGSKFTVDTSTISKDDVKALELSYSITVDEDILGDISAEKAYQLSFNGASKINAEVMIRLPGDHARSNASLYQKRGSLDMLQTVIVDHEGYAHFYLGAVDDQTEYYIGINVQQEQAQQPIVPEALYKEYNVTDQGTGVEYVITGRQSSWGMNLSQVTWIMIGGMTAVVVTVGFVMYLLNKRKLRMGYIPDLDEEFE